MDSSRTKSEIVAHNKAIRLAEDVRAWSKPISTLLSNLSDSWTDYDREFSIRELAGVYRQILSNLESKLSGS